MIAERGATAQIGLELGEGFCVGATGDLVLPETTGLGDSLASIFAAGASTFEEAGGGALESKKEVLREAVMG